MSTIRRVPSPNHDPRVIDVRFLVLHYTAVDLARTLDIFTDPARKAASHLVVDTDGTIYECVPCWDAPPLRAWHAGVSHWDDGATRWEKLNDWSVGVEVVNFNGNLLPFADAQYEALAVIVDRLRLHFPALRPAGAVLGHEQIAGFRGKADPGWCFDWQRFCTVLSRSTGSRASAGLSPALRDALARLAEVAPDAPAEANAFWERVSLLTETAVALAQQAVAPGS